MSAAVGYARKIDCRAAALQLGQPFFQVRGAHFKHLSESGQLCTPKVKFAHTAGANTAAIIIANFECLQGWIKVCVKERNGSNMNSCMAKTN